MELLNHRMNVVVPSKAVRRENFDDSPEITAEGVFFAYAPRVYNIARRMLSNDLDAEDITQDVFLQVVRKLDTFRGEAHLTTWLHRVTINAVLLHRRKQGRRRECHIGQGAFDALLRVKTTLRMISSSLAPDQQIVDNETREMIDAAITRLPEMYRDVFVLADVEGLSNHEIGRLLELKVPAVKSRLHRARRMMREALNLYYSPQFEGEEIIST
jgi:RNA polymerase sigma-70 factor (ECF subfamily)